MDSSGSIIPEVLDLVIAAINNTLRALPHKRRLDQERVEVAVRRIGRGVIDNAWGTRLTVKVTTSAVEAGGGGRRSA